MPKQTEMSENCKAGVWHRVGLLGSSYPCSRKAVRDGYCKQHHPDVKAAREQKATEKYEAQKREHERNDRIASAEMDVLMAAEAWYNPATPQREQALEDAVARLLEARKP